MQNALPCDKPHKGGRDSTVHIQTRPQTAPSAPKSMQQRDAGHAPQVLPSSAAQLPVDAALNAHGLTLLMVLLYAFFRPIATTTPIIFPNSRGRFLAGCTIPGLHKKPSGASRPGGLWGTNGLVIYCTSVSSASLWKISVLWPVAMEVAVEAESGQKPQRWPSESCPGPKPAPCKALVKPVGRGRSDGKKAAKSGKIRAFRPRRTGFSTNICARVERRGRFIVQ